MSISCRSSCLLALTCTLELFHRSVPQQGAGLMPHMPRRVLRSVLRNTGTHLKLFSPTNVTRVTTWGLLPPWVSSIAVTQRSPRHTAVRVADSRGAARASSGAETCERPPARTRPRPAGGRRRTDQEAVSTVVQRRPFKADYAALSAFQMSSALNQRRISAAITLDP